MLASHGRYPCAPWKDRPDFQWPDGKRLAVYLAVNVEHFPYGEPSGIDLDRPTLPWSQRSWLWRDYGNRVGGWKLLDLFEDLRLPVGVIVNTANYGHNPELLEAHRQRGDEIIAHGRSNAERQIDMPEADERTMIAEVTQSLAQYTGQRPAGWLSPYLTPSLVTSDLLAEAGYTYVLDWGICDEQPFWVQTRTTPILAVPYPIELNDQPTIVNRCATAAQYADMLVDQFDEMQRRAVAETLVYAISIHTFIMGQPFRLTHLRRALTHILAHRETLWVTRPGAIAQHYRTLPPAQQLTGA